MDSKYNRFDKNQVIEDIEVLTAESGLPEIKPDDTIQKIVKECSTLSYLQTLDPTRLAEYGVILSCYALYLHKLENDYKHKIGWYESNINHIIGSKLDQYEGYGFQEKSSKVKAHEPAAKDYDAARHRLQTQLDYINNLSFSLRLIIDNIKNLGNIKIKQGREY